MLRTQIRLTEEQHRALKGLASVQRVSVAELIRQGLPSQQSSAGI